MEQQNLPENAYTPLKPGEVYKPTMPAGSKPKETTLYSVTFGLLVKIIAVGFGNLIGRTNLLGQNVIIQSIGASSGVIVADAIFTLRKVK